MILGESYKFIVQSTKYGKCIKDTFDSISEILAEKRPQIFPEYCNSKKLHKTGNFFPLVFEEYEEEGRAQFCQ